MKVTRLARASTGQHIPWDRLSGAHCGTVPGGPGTRIPGGAGGGPLVLGRGTLGAGVTVTGGGTAFGGVLKTLGGSGP